MANDKLLTQICKMIAQSQAIPLDEVMGIYSKTNSIDVTIDKLRNEKGNFTYE